MKKNFWAQAIQVLIAALTALLTSLGVSACTL